VRQLKTYPTIGVCGLDCGLCPRHYTAGPSRCPGCGGPGFLDKHPSCSFITCCVKKKGLEVCGECPDFPCSKFKSDEEYRQAAASSSYPPPACMLPNLRFVRRNGIEEFVRQQLERIRLLETMIEGYDDGRSRSCFCRAVALLAPRTVAACLGEAEGDVRASVGAVDARGRARVLRRLLAGAGSREAIELPCKR